MNAAAPAHITQRRSCADAVYQQLRQEVSDFTLIPGDRLTETDISLRMNVSRTPVRQALFRLQQEGLVEVLFKSGWRVLPFDFDRFEQLYDLRQVLETTAVHRLCTSPSGTLQAAARSAAQIASLSLIWRVPASQRSRNAAEVALWDEAFHCSLVASAGNAEMARVHLDVTNRIRIIRRLDFTQQNRIDATYDEHAQILQAIELKRGEQAALLLRTHIQISQAEVRKITLHQVHMARQSAC